MEPKKIVYEGLCCQIKGKAALIDLFVKAAPEAFGRRLLEVIGDDRMEDFFEINAVGNMATLSLVWDEEQKERIFDLMIGKRMLSKVMEECSSSLIFFQRPLMEWNQKEVCVDALPFLVYALVRNERCKSALNDMDREDARQCYEAFAQSDYGEAPFFYWFLQDEKRPARLAAGLCLLIRREQEKERWYGLLMELLYRGYKPLKNVMKKWSRFCGADFMKLYTDRNDIVKSMSQAVAELVIAQDLGLVLVYDYYFYIILLSLCDFEKKMLDLPGGGYCTEEGKKSYRKMKKVYPDLDSCTACFYLNGGKKENDEESERELCESAAAIVGDMAEADPMELLFLNYQIHPRMLAAIKLEQTDIELIFSLFGEMGWEEYRQKILLAALCSYIRTLHQSCEEGRPDELDYQNRQAQKTISDQQNEIARLKEKVTFLEQQEESYKKMLKEQEMAREKLQDMLRRMSEKYAGEKEELIGLRNFVYQISEEPGEYRKTENVRAVLDSFKKERVVVIGGHEHWRSKMKEIFPQGLFLAGNNNNFDASVLRNKRYIIFNTDILKHSSYYRIVKEKKKEQRILYVHGNNVERCMAELEKQIINQQLA